MADIAMNECHVCKGQLEERLVTRLQHYQGQWYIIENLPALVCEQCGETYYTPETHDHVIDLVSKGVKPVRVETVPVLDANTA